MSDFDRVINTEVMKYENNINKLNRNNLKLNLRYTKTYQSSDLFNFQNNDNNENNFLFRVTDTKIGREDDTRWCKLKGLLQQNCKALPLAFQNVAVAINKNNKNKNKNTENSIDNSDNNSNNDDQSNSIVKHNNSDSNNSNNNDYNTTNNDNNINNNNDDNNNNNDYKSLYTTSGRNYGKEREEREQQTIKQNSAMIPISHVRNVLSDAGVQLGTEDSKRLENLLLDRISVKNSNNTLGNYTENYSRKTFHKNKGYNSMNNVMNNGVKDGLKEVEKGSALISLDQLCDIIGIPVIVSTTTKRKGTHEYDMMNV